VSKLLSQNNGGVESAVAANAATKSLGEKVPKIGCVKPLYCDSGVTDVTFLGGNAFLPRS